jgi:eukaryotic-like serine/threonine-protein kinase
VRGWRAAIGAVTLTGCMEAGSVIAGKYRVIEPLGRGGMGAVWRAEHVLLGTPCAIKLMDPKIAESGEGHARFSREARAAAALRSPHVVHVFDFGVDSGTPYIAMELLEGESLAQLLARTGRLEPAEVASLFTQLGRAVAKAHELGIVHRDLKPDNVFLARQDQGVVVKVFDFGIAKLTRDTALSVSSNTRTGTMLGTPSYMSPEQARGNRLVDHRTDLWALGVIAFECLCGSKPFLANALGDLIIQICTEPLPVPSDAAPVPRAFDAWFKRAAERDPNRRFQSATELTEALAIALGTSAPASQGLAGVFQATAPAVSIGQTPVAKTGSASTLTLRVGRRSRRPVLAATGAIVLAGVIGAVALMRSRSEVRPPELSKASARLGRRLGPERFPHPAKDPAPDAVPAASTARPAARKAQEPRPTQRRPVPASDGAPHTHKKWGI